MSHTRNPRFDLKELPDDQIKELLNSHQIGLTVAEARKLQFEILGRAPTLTELILFGIEGSEHCSYKSSRPYLKLFTTEGPDVILGAKEDAGVIRVATDQQGTGYAIVMSHESHNHPSQLVPYEGAATGVGGNVRDVCCMGAQVIAQADDLRFGSVDIPKNKWIYEGVVSGIAGYGNPIGVPSIAGGLQFDKGYDDNCLVTVVSLGVVAEDAIIHSYAPKHAAGHDLILVGKPTDNSGFGGASFASFELEADKQEQNKGAVQEPNAFLGRHMIKASNELFKRLKAIDAIDRVGFKDLGAGGIACASVELVEASGYGAVVQVEDIHTAEGEFPSHVILCAETQERYMWVSPPDLTPMILEHYNTEYALPLISKGAAARVIGKVTDAEDYIVTYRGEELVHAPAAEVTRGFLYDREVGELPEPIASTVFEEPEDLNEILRRLLGHENIASRHPLYEQYDKQVQGRTALEAGAGDAGVITPFNDMTYPEELRKIAVTLTTDQNPRQNAIDPYQGAVNAVVEAFCNTTAVGARAIALSDCLCYGNPEKPEQMRLFVEGCKGVADASDTLGIPVIAGNVSLYNESGNGSIPPSPMIAVLGRIEDVDHTIERDLHEAGLELLLVGDREAACGGSVYLELLDERSSEIPAPDLQKLMKISEAIRTCAQQGLITACHGFSEGRIAVALSEMAFSHQVGIEAVIPDDTPLRDDLWLFGESFGFIIAVNGAQAAACRAVFTAAGIDPVSLGHTTDLDQISIGSRIQLTVTEAKHLWTQGLRRRLS
ncbi:MAG: phosphoribosylformylglycinamidine synthase subunit PurL [Spirochaetia bacterium]|nr:phosphoribosylformylglycinamidine synthase subunit PurL [Spirochaetia bacterium]